MKEKKTVVFVNGTPKIKPEESVSNQLVRMGKEYMASQELEFYEIQVRKSVSNRNSADFDLLLNADAIVFTFPLYIFCLPGILMRFLQDFHLYLKENGGFINRVKVYAVVNCGFPEAFINQEAVRVIECFSRQTGAEFGFGTMIGSGGMLLGTMDAPFMKKMKGDLISAFQRIKDGILLDRKDSGEPVLTEANFPRKLYYFMGNRGWYSNAKANGLKKKELYRKPYLRSGQ